MSGEPESRSAFQLSQTCQDADEKLFGAITSDGHHVLNQLLPPQSQGSQNYNLRRRIHNYALPTRTGHLTDKNFIQRML